MRIHLALRKCNGIFSLFYQSCFLAIRTCLRIARGGSVITKSIIRLYRETRPPLLQHTPANEAETVLKLSCFTNAREHDIACELLNVTSIMVNRRVNG